MGIALCGDKYVTHQLVVGKKNNIYTILYIYIHVYVKSEKSTVVEELEITIFIILYYYIFRANLKRHPFYV